MPPRPQKHLIPTPAVYLTTSDLEPDSDVPFTTIPAQPSIQQTLPTAPPASRTAADLNLPVLRRHDPAITSILSIAPYAVIYTFSGASSSWEKSGVEGALFVCSLADTADPVTGHPIQQRSAVFVLNRRGLQNFSLELLSAEDVEITSDYVILQGREGDAVTVIYGLWIYAEEGSSTSNMRARNAAIIQECAARAEASRAMFGAYGVPDQSLLNVGNGIEGQHGYEEPADQGTRSVLMEQLFAPSRAQQQPQYYQQQPLPPHQQAAPGNDVLTNLFRQARQDYRSAI